jgi:homoaconitase/3-isopropylmalate dehydratase large subunit
MNLTEKIISTHLIGGQMVAGEEISIRIDQTLTQDSTGTMAYLQLEAMEIPRVKTQKSLAYIDHNTLQAALKTPMITNTFKPWPKNMESIFPVPVMVFVTRCI